MKKIIVCAVILALGLLGGALAADSFWTRNDDLYYHGAQSCGGEEGRVPISEEAALAFDKYICPVCCAYPDTDAAVDAVSRGGTIVVRFSDSWLSSHELTSVFGWGSETAYSGKRALRMLGQYLHDAAYGAFMDEYLAGGLADGRANMPHILAADGALIMNRRHIENCWYVIVRPGDAFLDSWDMYWRVSSLDLHMEDGVLTSRFDLQTVEEIRTLELEDMKDIDSVYERSGDGLELAVYRALNGNIAVIREQETGERPLENVQLRIDGAPAPIELSGYADGGAAIYCCMLTGGELAALEKNAKIEIRHVENVNSRVYRAADADEYTYYSIDDDEAVFSFALADGQEMINHNFVLVLDGDPDRFVGPYGESFYIYDYRGGRYYPSRALGMDIQRLTPLVWNGDGGVFLAESREDADSTAEDMLSAGGIELGERYEIDIGKEWGDYRCWLLDENGDYIVESFNNQGFIVRENGEIVLIDWEGMDYLAYSPDGND